MISDFDNTHSDKVIKQYAQLSIHHDILNIHIYDPLEKNLPKGVYQFSNTKSQKISLDTRHKKTREAYQTHYESRIQLLDKLYKSYRISYLNIATSEKYMHSTSICFQKSYLMTKEALLAQLKDIKVPEPVSWWPLAPGWYILMAILLIIIILSLVLIYKAKTRKKHLNTLKSEITNLYDQYPDNSHQYAQRLSPLLKRIALLRFKSIKINQLHGKTWEVFLNRYSQSESFNTLTLAAYNPKISLNIPDINASSLAYAQNIYDLKPIYIK